MIKAIENQSKGESKYRLLSKIQRMIMRADSTERVVEVLCRIGLEDLYPVWFKEVELFLKVP